VVLSLVVFILDALVLAGMVVIYSLLNDSMHSIYRGYRPRVDISGVDGSIIAVVRPSICILTPSLALCVAPMNAHRRFGTRQNQALRGVHATPVGLPHCEPIMEGAQFLTPTHSQLRSLWFSECF
jgi:hypothetical protein